MGWGGQSVFQLVIIQGSSQLAGLFLYNGLGAPGNPPQFAAVASGVTTDPFGNAIGTSKVLIQGNVITESGGIFRTAALAPLIQLDGIHNAYLEYNAASVLTETIAPVGTSDGLGSVVLAGITTYSASAPFIAVQLEAGNIQWQTAPGQGGPWTANGPQINYTGVSFSISSDPKSGAFQASLQMFSGASQAATQNAFAGPVTLSNLAAPSTGLTSNASILFASGGHLNTISTATGGDGNNYDTERLSKFLAADIAVPVSTNVTLFSKAVAAGTYEIDGIIKGVQGATAVGQGVQFNGPAVSFNDIFIESNAVGNTSVTDSDLTGALPVAHLTPAWGATVVFYVRFRGILTFSASGTFTVVGQGAATGAWTAKAASLFSLYPVVAT